jgi:hypothetical protein
MRRCCPRPVAGDEAPRPARGTPVGGPTAAKLERTAQANALRRSSTRFASPGVPATSFGASTSTPTDPRRFPRTRNSVPSSISVHGPFPVRTSTARPFTIDGSSLAKGASQPRSDHLMWCRSAWSESSAGFELDQVSRCGIKTEIKTKNKTTERKDRAGREEAEDAARMWGGRIERMCEPGLPGRAAQDAAGDRAPCLATRRLG